MEYDPKKKIIDNVAPPEKQLFAPGLDFNAQEEDKKRMKKEGVLN